MIILIIIVFTILTFYGFMFINNRAIRWTVGGLSLLILALSIFTLTLHIKDNFGMKEVTTVSSRQIYTAGETTAPYGMLMEQEIGTNTNNYVLIYRTTADEKSPAVNFKPDTKNIISAVKKSATYELTDTTKAKVVTTTTRRVFSSSFLKWLLDVGNGEQDELVKQRSVVQVPKDTWLVLTEAQAKQLQKEAPAMQAQAAASLKANPAQAAQMAELQKADPQAYAKVQVQQIKKVLGIKD